VSTRPVGVGDDRRLQVGDDRLGKLPGDDAELRRDAPWGLLTRPRAPCTRGSDGEGHGSGKAQVRARRSPAGAGRHR
jgi:hypothetical protein